MNGVIGALIVAGLLGGGFYWVELRPVSQAAKFLQGRGYSNLTEVTGLSFLASAGDLWVRDFYFEGDGPAGTTFAGVKIDVLRGTVLQACASVAGGACETDIPLSQVLVASN